MAILNIDAVTFMSLSSWISELLSCSRSSMGDSFEIWILKEKVCDFDEFGFDTGLRDEVYDWLAANVGPWGTSWKDDVVWMFQDYGMTSISFKFKEANHALLFKLTWG